MNNILYKVQQYLGKASKESVKLDKGLVEEFGEACKNALLKQFEEERRDKFELRMSNVGRPLCQLQMEKSGAEAEPMPYNAKMRNLFGDLIKLFHSGTGGNALFSSEIGDIKIQPIVRSNSKSASRIIIRARKSAKGDTKLLNPLFLYKDENKIGQKKQYTSEIHNILRNGYGLNF